MCDDVNLYVRAKNETAGKVSARAGIRAEVLADIESVDVKQCRAASSSVESCEKYMQDGIEAPAPECGAGGE